MEEGPYDLQEMFLFCTEIYRIYILEPTETANTDNR